MKTERGSPPAMLEWGVAKRALPGETVCGDLHLVQPFQDGVLVAAVDGLGHGEEAASAAQIAVETLRANACESVVSLLERCHEVLRATRGATVTLASFNVRDGTMTWVGVGSVEGVLLHADEHATPALEYALLY